MKKTIPSLRLDEETIALVKRSLEKYNRSSLFKISFQEYRRLALEVFSKMILQDYKIPIEIT